MAVDPKYDYRNKISAPLALRNNNPYALRYAGEDWEGLSSREQNVGFYEFTNQDYGTRAGLITLYNGYIAQGLATPRQIISKYAPATDNNDVEAYAGYLAGKLGIGIDDGIQKSQFRDLARWIPVYEMGSTYKPYFDYNSIDRGLELAKSHPYYADIYSFFGKTGKQGEIAKAGFDFKKLTTRLFIPLIVVIAMVVTYVIVRNRKRRRS